MPVRPQLRALACTPRSPAEEVRCQTWPWFLRGGKQRTQCFESITYLLHHPARGADGDSCNSPLPITHCIVPPIARDVDARRLDADEPC